MSGDKTKMCMSAALGLAAFAAGCQHVPTGGVDEPAAELAGFREGQAGSPGASPAYRKEAPLPGRVVHAFRREFFGANPRITRTEKETYADGREVYVVHYVTAGGASSTASFDESGHLLRK